MNRSIWLLSIAAFMASSMISILHALLPQISKDFSVSVDQAALAITAFTFAYGGFQLAYGWIGARIGTFRTAAIGALLAAFGAMVSALATDILTLAIGRFVSGMTVAAVIPMSMAYIGETVDYRDRQPIMARFMIGAVMGGIFGQALAGMFAQIFDWRDLFWVLSAGLTLISLALFRELKGPLVPTHQPGGNLANPLVSYGRILSVPWARVIIAAVFAEGLLLGIYPFLSSHLADNFGVPPIWIGLTMACLGIGGLIYIAIVKVIHRKMGEKGLALWGGTIMGSGYVLLTISPAGWPMMAAAVWLGLGYTMLHNTLQTNATQMAPFDRSAAIAIFAFSLFFSQSIGTVLAGQLTLSFGYPAIFAIAAFGSFALALAMRTALAKKPCG